MERRAIAIRGTVQGVGFRPFVFGLASGLQLSGFVRNQTDGVFIEVEGETNGLDQFVSQLTLRPPPLARIDQLECRPRATLGGSGFRIDASAASDAAGPVVLSPDVGICDDCLRELFSPSDRRYRYPFLNCTNCGPRLTIIQSAPYDRQRTTMSGFAMCPACRAEYEDPRNRRFHAQPTCCPKCGPQLSALDADGRVIEGVEPLAWFAEALRAGKIGAIKGLGGYHLACDAKNEEAVAGLRRRKNREAKPFAVMVRNLDSVAKLCRIDSYERELLASFRRPIVLLQRRDDAEIASGIAPGNPTLGVMLPYTPLHYLLLEAMDGEPLVMTSGNRCDEPIAYREPDVFEQLRGLADVFLSHNRPIHVRCDDSVTRIVGTTESPIRRSRGHAPQPLRLAIECPRSILAVGGQLKGTFALGRERQAILSHHLGDLDDYRAYQAFERDIALYERLFEVRPQYIAHDLHPDYASTRYARSRASSGGMRCIPVQHHHAHMASCMAEHGLAGPVIGVSFDGTGYGTDGAIWGGEFLIGDFRQFHRAAHLRYVPMPGGERAVRQPWRMAVSHLRDAEIEDSIVSTHVPREPLRAVLKMLERQFNSPLTSSAGRLFDAVACLAGVRDEVSFEGQAAMELEWLAGDGLGEDAYPFEIEPQCGTAALGCDPRCGTAEGDRAIDALFVIDTRPLIGAVAHDAAERIAPSTIARRSHTTVAAMIVAACTRIRERAGIEVVVLSGGVFLNALLTIETEKRLKAAEFRVYRHQRVPPNDGGLCLGQLAVAAAQMA